MFLIILLNSGEYAACSFTFFTPFTYSVKLSGVQNPLLSCSTDQYGSRFIQQKLETATLEDKMKIFPWVIPHVRALMTDTFGNYVIQKVAIWSCSI